MIGKTRILNDQRRQRKEGRGDGECEREII